MGKGGASTGIDTGQHCANTKKGNLADCNNWRGVRLLSIPSEVFCKVVMMRVTEKVDEILRKEQAGFRPRKGTIERIFTLRNILEQCNEWQRDICKLFGF